MVVVVIVGVVVVVMVGVVVFVVGVVVFVVAGIVVVVVTGVVVVVEGSSGPLASGSSGSPTVMRDAFFESNGVTRTSELMLSIPSLPQGDQMVDSTPKVSDLR